MEGWKRVKNAPNRRTVEEAIADCPRGCRCKIIEIMNRAGARRQQPLYYAVRAAYRKEREPIAGTRDSVAGAKRYAPHTPTEFQVITLPDGTHVPNA